MIAELIAKITADTSGLNKAESALKQFEHNVTSVFKRQPAGEMRAEAAIGGFIRQLTAGDVPGAIESLTRRMNVFGLVGSVAIGGIILGITKAIQASNELNAKFEAMGANLQKTPSQLMGMEALGSMIEDNAQKLGDVAGEHIAAGIGARMKQLPQSLMAFAESIFKLDPTVALEADARMSEAEKARNEAIRLGAMTQMNEALKEQGAARIRIAEITDAQARGDKEGVAILKAQDAAATELFKAKQTREAVYTKMGDSYTNMKPEEKDAFDLAMKLQEEGIKEGVGRGFDAAKDMAERETDIRKEQLATEIQIAEVKQKGLSADVEKAVLAQINIQHLANQLKLQEGIIGAEDEAAAKLKAAQADVAADQTRKGRGKFEDIFQQSLYTVDELAKMKRTSWIGGDMNVAQFNAREIQRLENRAKIEKEQGHPMEAFAALTHAQQIRAGMPFLKASEKAPEFAFAAAIDSATVFKGMLTNLENIAGFLANPNNPFLNK